VEVEEEEEEEEERLEWPDQPGERSSDLMRVGAIHWTAERKARWSGSGVEEIGQGRGKERERRTCRGGGREKGEGDEEDSEGEEGGEGGGRSGGRRGGHVGVCMCGCWISVCVDV
jgi:hypothetical protein